MTDSAFTGYYAKEPQSKTAELIFTKNNLSAADYQLDNACRKSNPFQGQASLH